MARAVALFSGGLDAALALQAIREQGIAVEPVWIRVPCGMRAARVHETAARLQLPLTELAPPVDYGDLLYAAPRSARDEQAPCRDCRVALFRTARQYADHCGADFVVSGEVLGQDARLQRRRDLEMIAIGSGLEDRLLRPLSAQRLSPTAVERAGIVERASLGDWHGEARRPQHALAAAYGWSLSWFARSTCALCEAALAAQIQNWRRSELPLEPTTLEALRLGRVSWFDARTVVVLSRRAAEGAELHALFHRAEWPECWLIEPTNRPGPTALVIGSNSAAANEFARQTICERLSLADSSGVAWRELRRPPLGSLDSGPAR